VLVEDLFLMIFQRRELSLKEMLSWMYYHRRKDR
jgi:hypothetical protein